MATGLRPWLGGVLLGMALLALWIFPWDGGPPATERQVSPQLERFEALLGDVLHEREHLRRLTWLDSLTAALNPEEPTASALLMPELLDPADVAAFRARLDEELSQLGSRRAAFGVLVTAAPKPEPGWTPAWEAEHDEYYVGEHGSTQYCFVVRLAHDPASALRARGWGDSKIFAPESILGPCGYVLRYGLPGTRISEWLKAGSFWRGMYPPQSPAYGSARLEPEPESAREEMLGASLIAQSCIRGSIGSCSKIFLDPDDTEERLARSLTSAVPELWEVAGVQTHHLQVIDHQMLAELEARYGRERFARFWTSPETVDEAFQEAFGVEPALWLQGWAREYFVSGPSRADRVEAGGIAVMVLLGSLGVLLRTVRRRSVA